jgi:hypothetical protein
VALLATWARLPQKRGGFADDQRRSAAEQLLCHVVNLAGEELKGVACPVHLVDVWQPAFPCLQDHATCSKVQLQSDGPHVLLTSLREACRAGVPLASRYWSLLPKVVGATVNPCVPWVDLLACLVGAINDRAIADAFLAQVVFLLATALERHFTRQGKGAGVVDGEADGGTAWATRETARWSYELENLCVRYVAAANETFLHARHVSVAVDAHNGCGKKLLNAVVATPTGVLALAPPQAPGPETAKAEHRFPERRPL